MSQATQQALATASRIGWAAPTKRYPAAAVARTLLEQSRTSIAKIMGCRPSEVAFVPAPPDDTMASVMRAATTSLAGPASSSQTVKLIISEVEEVRVLRAADHLSSTPPPNSRIDLIHVPVDGTGTVSTGAVMEAVAEGPSVVVLQAANGELGIRQPLAAVSESLPDSSRLIVDGRHHVGRCADPVPGDLVVADPTTWGGPPGASILVARGQSSLSGLPAPTSGPLAIEPTNPPVPLIAAAALSLESTAETVRGDLSSSRELTRLLRQLVNTRTNDVQILGDSESQLGYIAMFSFLYVAADELVDELAKLGWSVASGSSCTSDTQRPLHVLEAIGALTHGNLRVSLPPWTTESTIRAFVDDLVRTVNQIREDAGAGEL